MILLHWTAKYKNFPNKEEYGKKIEPDSQKLQFIIGFIHVNIGLVLLSTEFTNENSLSNHRPTQI